MTLKNAIFTSSGAPRDFRRREIDSAPSRAPESGRIWAALTRKGEPYGESQLKSPAFLHFHKDPAGIFADVSVDGPWQRLPVNSKKDEVALLRLVSEVVAARSSAR